MQELVALGLSAPFADKAADFSQPSPQPLYISDVLQSVTWHAVHNDPSNQCLLQ
jgi:serine protease inhibitor